MIYLFHSLCILFCFCYPSYMILTKKTGLNLLGNCSVDYQQIPYGTPAFITIYILISFYTIYFFKKSVPDNQSLLIYKQNFLNFYHQYIYATCFIWIIQLISLIILQLNCHIFLDRSIELPFVSIFNIIKLASPIILSAIRIQDPTIKKKMLKFRRKILSRKSITSGIIQQSFDCLLEVSDSENWFNLIHQNLRNSFLTSILSGIKQSFDEEDLKNQIYTELTEKYKSNLSQKSFSYSYCEENINSFYSKLSEEQNLFSFFNEHNLTLENLNQILTIPIDEEQLNLSMVFYTPQFFRQLAIFDNINPFISFNPENNLEQIQNFCAPDGGKSGQFFFFTEDGQFILKTITQTELKAFLFRIKQFALHFLSKDDTLISKIYGQYIYITNYHYQNLLLSSRQKTHLIIMRNLSQTKKKYILRTFDMKGSEYDREVLKKSSKKRLSNVTLKDKDFLKIEKKIMIDDNIKQKLKIALYRDVQFFREVGLIDYSLLVIKVDWGRFMKENNIQSFYQIKDQKFTKNLSVIPSMREAGIYYQIGIIDYLQEWNTSKKIEQGSKKLINANANLDTSAQNPDNYANRFITKLVNQIL